MSSLPKTSRRETTREQRSAVWTWYLAGKSYSEIGRLEELIKPIVAGIIRRAKQATGKDRFSNKKQLEHQRRLLLRLNEDSRELHPMIHGPL
jgi:hypothetical protein